MYDNYSIDMSNTSGHTWSRLNPVIKNRIEWNE